MKKVTKTAALILAMAMTVSALTACGESSATTGAADTETADDGAGTTDAAVSDEAADDAADAGSTAVTRTEGVITFGTNAEFPPFEFVAGTGVIDMTVLIWLSQNRSQKITV